MNDMMKYISFTKNETKVILFIVAILVGGFSIKYYKQVISSDQNTHYDFSASDSEFRKLSGNTNKNSSVNGKSDSSVRSDLDLANDLKSSDDSITARSNLSKEKISGDIPEKIININTATKVELIDLPGIGESIAEKIIAYRESRKGFRKTEELMNVSGIGKKKYEKIKSYIKAE